MNFQVLEQNFEELKRENDQLKFELENLQLNSSRKPIKSIQVNIL